MIAALALVLAAAPIADPEPVESAARLKACGFREVSVIRDSDMGGEIVATISDTDATDAELDCAGHEDADHYIIIDLPENLRQRYWQRYRPISEAAGARMMEERRAEARKYFADRGQLDGVPDLTAPDADPAPLKQAAAKLCGAKAAAILDVVGDEVRLHPGMNSDYDTAECVLQLIMASHATKFGFVGNEAYAPDPKRPDEKGEH